ncbi:MAG: sulfotransferase [Pseudomonadota bacterium]
MASLGPKRILYASPVEPSGASWLLNCFLELDIQVNHKPVVDKVWRNVTPRPPTDRMWLDPGDDRTRQLDPKANEIRKWLPAIGRRERFEFRDDVIVEYVQDMATREHQAQPALFFVRDPRDAIYSMFKRRPREQSLDTFLDFPHPATLLDRIDQWALHASSWLTHPHVQVFRFEDYKADAKGLLTRILAVLQIGASAVEIERVVALSTFEKARAGEARYRARHPGDQETANRAGKVGDWKAQAEAAALAARVADQAGSVLRSLGYDVDARQSRLRGLASISRLDACRSLPVAQTLLAGTSEHAVKQSHQRLVSYAQDLNRDALANAGLASQELRQLLDTYVEYLGDQHPDLANRLGEMRASFEDGADYQFERVRALLAHRRATKDLPLLQAPQALIGHGVTASGLDPEDAHGHLQGLDREALGALCDGFARTPLRFSFFGRKRVEQALIDAIAKQVLLRHHQARARALEKLELAPAIAIVAPFRSGTTLLQRLLAQDPANRYTRSWEVFQPPPAAPTLRGDVRYFAEDARVASTRRFVEGLHRRHPRLADLHPTDAVTAEECFGLLESSMKSHSFMLHGAVDGYLPWLDALGPEHWRAAYADYADQLRLLQWWFPGDRWVLKSPFHLWQLGALVKAVQPRVVVQIHRPAALCVVSFCELLQATFESLGAPVDPRWIGGIAREAMCRAVQRNGADRARLAPRLFYDVDYRELVQEPIETVRRLYAHAGFTLDDPTAMRMHRWLREGETQARRGRRAQPADFGLQADALEEEFSCYRQFAPASG